MDEAEKDRRHYREVSIIDKEKATYQREMMRTINAATQRYRRRLGKFVGGKTEDSDLSDSTSSPTLGVRRPTLGRPVSKNMGYFNKQVAEKMTSKSKAVATMDPLLKRDLRRRGLVGPTAYTAHRREATSDTQHSSMFGAINKLRIRNLTVREAGEKLPRRQYGPYEGFATMSLIHPTTHLVLQNSQKFRTDMIREDAERKRLEGEEYCRLQQITSPERKTPDTKKAGRGKRGRSFSLVGGTSPELPPVVRCKSVQRRRRSSQDSFLAKMVEEAELKEQK